MSRVSRRLSLLALTVAAVVGLGGEARAHGGEDHGTPPPAATVGGEARTAFGTTGQFEVLVKLTPRAGEPASLMVFLADWATNEPLGGATVALQILSNPPVAVTAEAAGAPGIYHAIATVPAGTFPLIATITAGDRIDLVEVAPLDFAPAAATTAAHRHGLPWLRIALGAGVVLVLIAAVVIIARRRGGRPVVASAAIVLVLSAPMVARGHGGEDHGAVVETKAARPGGAVVMAKEAQFLLGIRTRVAQTREVSARIETVGRVVPRIDGHAEIAAPQPGRVMAPGGGALPFLGDRVRKGQVLVVLEQTPGAADSGELRARELEARTAIQQATARRDQARREATRSHALEGIVSKREIEEAELALALAEREVELAKQQAGLFGGGALRRISITAPIDGVVAAAEVSLGEQVAADQKLYTILEPSTLWVEADVFERDLARVAAVGTSDIHIDGVERALPARLFRLGQIVDSSTRTVKAIFAVDNAAGVLRPGMFAEVAISAGKPRTALVVPDAAVVEDGGRRFVYVHLTPEEFGRREVVLGERDGDDWAVAAGIEAGARVVVQGTYQLRTTR